MQEDERPEGEWQFAVELAAMPEVWRALLELHVGGRDGRCLGCHSQVQLAPHWPCTLYRAAAQARRIAAELSPASPRPFSPPTGPTSHTEL